MSAGLFADVLAASLQAALVVLAAAAAAPLVERGAPRGRLAYWRGVLVLALSVPFLAAPLPRAEGLSLLARGASGGAAPGAGAAWREAVLFGLALGALLRLLRVAAGLLRLRQIRRRAVALTTVPIDDLSERVGARAWLGLSSDVPGPVTFGWWRPAVLLPPAAVELPEAERRAVLCHELLHVRRRDALHALLEEVVASLLWFHPAVSLAIRRIREAREALVDHQAVSLLGDRESYLKSLVSVASLCSARPALQPVPGFFHARQLERRISLLMEEVVMKRSIARVRLAAGSAVVLAAAFAAVALFPLRPLHAGQKDHPKLRVLEKVEPAYPPEAREKKTEGAVVSELTVDRDGKVESVRILKGAPVFEEATRQALLKWRFEPPAKGAVALTITINYTLDAKK